MNNSQLRPALDYASESSPRYNPFALASLLCAAGALLPLPAGYTVASFEINVPTPVAIAALALIPLGGLGAFALSLIAIYQFERSPGRYHGRLMATVGMLIGMLFGLFGTFIFLLSSVRR